MRNGDSTRTSTTDRCFHSARQHLIRSILHLPRFGPICIDRLQLPRDLSVIVPTVSIPEGDITMKTLLKTAMLTGACMIAAPRSEEHTSELQSLMHISYAVFCLKKKKTRHTNQQELK